MRIACSSLSDETIVKLQLSCFELKNIRSTELKVKTDVYIYIVTTFNIF